MLIWHGITQDYFSLTRCAFVVDYIAYMDLWLSKKKKVGCMYGPNGTKPRLSRLDM